MTDEAPDVGHFASSQQIEIKAIKNHFGF